MTKKQGKKNKIAVLARGAVMGLAAFACVSVFAPAAQAMPCKDAQMTNQRAGKQFILVCGFGEDGEIDDSPAFYAQISGTKARILSGDKLLRWSGIGSALNQAATQIYETVSAYEDELGDNVVIKFKRGDYLWREGGYNIYMTKHLSGRNAPLTKFRFKADE